LFNHLVVKMTSELTISQGGTFEWPMFFHEFEHYLEQPESEETLGLLIHIVRNFHIKHKTIFWIHLVFNGYVSAMLVNHMGGKLDFS